MAMMEMAVCTTAPARLRVPQHLHRHHQAHPMEDDIELDPTLIISVLQR
jgi:hypothetical protein